MRKQLIAILAWATLAGGTCVLNALTACLIHAAGLWLLAGASQWAFWPICAVAFSLLSPLWILALLAWFRMQPGPQARASTLSH